MAGKLWSETEIKYLYNNYNKQSVKSIAQQLNRNYNSVQRKAQSLGLCQPKATPPTPWTEEEIAILERNYEKIGPTKLAKRLNRSLDSVKRKAAYLGLNFYTNDCMTMSQLCQAFQCNQRVIHRWISKYNLPMKLSKASTTIYRITSTDFWKWAESHKDIIPFHKYEKYSLLPEPNWLKEYISQSNVINHRRKITAYEKNYVVRHRYNDESFAQIAADLGRTEDSVKHIWRKTIHEIRDKNTIN